MRNMFKTIKEAFIADPEEVTIATVALIVGFALILAAFKFAAVLELN
jgi:hypothetical protein